jgi:hypothetical protein
MQAPLLHIHKQPALSTTTPIPDTKAQTTIHIQWNQKNHLHPTRPLPPAQPPDPPISKSPSRPAMAFPLPLAAAWKTKPALSQKAGSGNTTPKPITNSSSTLPQILLAQYGTIHTTTTHISPHSLIPSARRSRACIGCPRTLI